MGTGSQLWAHRGDGEPQSLTEHLTDVSKISGALSAKLGLPLAGELIGLLHDLGKATATFQNYLNGTPEFQEKWRGKIDHSTAGAQTLIRLMREEVEPTGLAGLVAQWLGLCIVSHHGGLIDCLKPQGDDGLQERLHKPDASTREVEAWRSLDGPVRARIVELARNPQLLEQSKAVLAKMLGSGTHGDRAVQLGLFTRMLFSCLIDADRTNTADYEAPTAAAFRQQSRYERWDVLLERLTNGLAVLSSETSVGRLRAEVSAACFTAASRPRGAYTLTVPTGGGKTLAALRFALEHARIHDLERVVFVSPYISIVEQNAAVARELLETAGVPFGSVVLEHHSNLAIDTGKLASRNQWRARVLAENWDAPIVFTTMVQVLEALFGSGTRSVRRLHSLARAVLVFDEVQTLPLKAAYLFNNAVNLLTTYCGATVLLCTATQPLLDKVQDRSNAVHLAPQPELIGDVGALFTAMKRYTVFDHTAKPERWTCAEAAELAQAEATAHGSCLVIVNTKHHAREIFELCRSGASGDWLVLHLSTAMCPAHRLEVLDKLKVTLKRAGTKKVLCVSTQLIEAGVDIDFATVVRDLAGLDSLAQAAGRCNRHGTRAELGRVHVIHLGNLPKQLTEIQQNGTVSLESLGAWQRVHPEQLFPLDDPAQMQEYYAKTFYRRAAEMVYPIKHNQRDDSLLSMLGGNGQAISDAKRKGRQIGRSVLLQSFQTANEQFELIGETQGIVAPFGNRGKEIVADLAAAHDLEGEWQLQRTAQRYTISVYQWQFQRLVETGAVYAVAGDTGVYCLRPEFYDEDYGLRNEGGLMEVQTV